MSTPDPTDPSRSQRRLRAAGLVALVGCAACCALPILVAAGFGSGIATALAALITPGTELVVGGALFLGVLAAAALRQRARRRAALADGAAAEGAACSVDGSGCRTVSKSH